MRDLGRVGMGVMTEPNFSHHGQFWPQIMSYTRRLGLALYDSRRKHASIESEGLGTAIANCGGGQEQETVAKPAADTRHCKEEVPMDCPRCHGLMVGDDFIDVRESYVPMSMGGLRCVSCGNIVDPIIARNRMRQVTGVVSAREADMCEPLFSGHAKAA